MAVWTVRQGETLATIASAHGFTDPGVLWNLAENQSLAAAGRTPATLAPGDSLFIPDLKTRQLSVGPETRRAVTVKTRPVRLRLTLQRLGGKPVAGTPVTLKFGDSTTSLTTDGEGGLEVPLEEGAEAGELVLGGAETALARVRIPVLVGHLDPVTVITGQEARLNSLGYRAGTAGDPGALPFRSAVEEFQCDERLVVDGVCGPKTQDRLVKVHGC